MSIRQPTSGGLHPQPEHGRDNPIRQPTLARGVGARMANALCDVMGAVGDSAQLAFSLPLRRPRTVFIFHSISAISRPDSSETHRPEVFERFLRWLAQRSVVGEARAIVDPVLPAHGQAVAWLSFDDGFLDHYTTVFRLLLEHKMTATFFIPTSVVDSPGMITRPMVREMSDRGMTIGSHSVSHCRLSDCQPLEIWRELTESRAYLEDLTGRPCDQLAYPFGYHNELARNMARRAGYRMAFASTPTTPFSARFALPRIAIPNTLRATSYLAALYDARRWRRNLRRYEWFDRFVHGTLGYHPERLERPRALR